MPASFYDYINSLFETKGYVLNKEIFMDLDRYINFKANLISMVGRDHLKYYMCLRAELIPQIKSRELIMAEAHLHMVENRYKEREAASVR